jgi:hypothetical protein
MPADHPEMPANEVLAFVRLLEQNHINIILDGGWGVDALLGRQTRPHSAGLGARDMDYESQVTYL